MGNDRDSMSGVPKKKMRFFLENPTNMDDLGNLGVLLF